MGGEDDNLHGGMMLAQMLHQMHAACPGHVQIGEHHFELGLLEQVDPLFCRAGVVY